jgi:hypothetical protein
VEPLAEVPAAEEETSLTVPEDELLEDATVYLHSEPKTTATAKTAQAVEPKLASTVAT